MWVVPELSLLSVIPHAYQYGRAVFDPIDLGLPGEQVY